MINIKAVRSEVKRSQKSTVKSQQAIQEEADDDQDMEDLSVENKQTTMTQPAVTVA